MTLVNADGTPFERRPGPSVLETLPGDPPLRVMTDVYDDSPYPDVDFPMMMRRLVFRAGQTIRRSQWDAGFVAPTIREVSPDEGPQSGGTRVTITGERFAPSTQVHMGGAAATAVDVEDGETLACTTPVGAAGAADVAVTTPGGTSTKVGGFTYTAVEPTIATVSPASGSQAGGTRITVTGMWFTSGAAVTVGGAAATAVAVEDSTRLTCTTPAGAVGAADVAVTTPGGTATETGAFIYTAAQPTIATVSPASGSQAGGTRITVTGMWFTSGAAVTVGGTAAESVVVEDDTRLTCTTPAGPVSAVDVAVTTPGGTATKTDAFTYTAEAPTIASVSPVSGSQAGGTRVTVTGAWFSPGAAVTVGGTAATAVTVEDATRLAFTTPAGPVGAADVAVTTPGGTATETGAFTYTAAQPTIATVSPASGPQAGGTQITITGAWFTPDTTVAIGGTAAQGVTVESATRLTCTTPAGAVGAADVAVTTPGGTATETGAFTYI